MPNKNKEELNAKNFKCNAVFRPDYQDAYLEIHIGSANIKWHDKTQTINFKHLFVELLLENGVKFDEDTLTHHDSKARDNKVDINFGTAEKSTSETSSKESSKFGFNKAPHGESSSESGEKHANEKGSEQSTFGSFTDLIIECSHLHPIKPTWKIYHVNPSPLSISIKNRYKIGELIDLDSDDKIEVKGAVRTCDQGFEIYGENPGMGSKFSSSYAKLRRALWERIVKKDLAEPIPINFKLVRGEE